MHQSSARTPFAIATSQQIYLRLVIAVLLALTLSAGWMNAAAAPGMISSTRASLQNAGYLEADEARKLDLEFPVLVPSSVPAPFSGAPSVSGGGGSYSLYWMNPGGDPTFLYVTGDVGGSPPAGSRDDFNNELSINATVRGVDAIHDVTTTYDDVWWVENGVLYSVQSRNMTGADSLSLANSLIALAAPPPDPVTEEAPPETAEPEQEPDPTSDAPDPVDPSLPGIPPPSATESEPTTQAQPTSQPEPTAQAQPTSQPEPTAETEAQPGPKDQVSSAIQTASTPSAQPIETSDVGGSGAPALDATPLPTASAPVPGTVIAATPGTPAASDDPSRATPDATPDATPSVTPGAPLDASLSDGTGSSVAASDGTGGPPPPVTGSDGTGGTSDLSLTPERP